MKNSVKNENEQTITMLLALQSLQKKAKTKKTENIQDGHLIVFSNVFNQLLRVMVPSCSIAPMTTGRSEKEVAISQSEGVANSSFPMEYSEDLKDTAEEQKIVEKHKMKTEELAMKQPNKKEEEASNSPVTNGNNV